MNWQEKAAGRINPSGAVGSEAASGNDVVYMRMMLQVLPPGVEYAEESDVCSEMPGIAGKLEHGRGAGAEEQVVEQPLVLESQSGEFMRQREDDMKVRNGQQFIRTRGQPLGTRVALALGTVPIAA